MLWRKTMDNGILQSDNLFRFWVWCLLKASHKEHKFYVGAMEVELKRGQFVFGLNQAAKELNLGVQSVRTCIKSLVKSENLTYKPTHHFSIISVCNWDAYQNPTNKANTPTNTPLTHDQHTTNTPLTTNNNGKHGENGNNGETDPHGPVSESTLMEYKGAVDFIKLHPAFSNIPHMAIENTLKTFLCYREYWPKMLRQFQSDNAGVDVLKYAPCETLRISMSRYAQFNNLPSPFQSN